MYLLDTCVCVDFLRGRVDGLLNAVLGMGEGGVCVPSIVETELHYGAAKSEKSQRNLEKTITLLSLFPSVPFDGACAACYGIIRSQLERKGTIIGPMDLLIAATTLANDATVVTNNVRKFQRVPGLKVEHWEDLAS